MEVLDQLIWHGALCNGICRKFAFDDYHYQTFSISEVMAVDYGHHSGPIPSDTWLSWTGRYHFCHPIGMNHEYPAHQDFVWSVDTPLFCLLVLGHTRQSREPIVCE
eukprot:scaffold202398_cov19-Prasinocladus_malaysianus.AAC.1